MNMKRCLQWVLLLLASLSLPGCVTYYYPVVDSTDGVYYAADDPVYRDYSADYSSVRYYPWWSIDYLYLGSGHYGSGWSLGLGVGMPAYPAYGWAYYPSWYYGPWYGSFWYGPSYAYWPWYGYGWRNHYWYSHYRAYHDGHHRGHHPPGGYAGHQGSRHPGDRYAAGPRDGGRVPDPAQSRPRSRNPLPANVVPYGERGDLRRVSVAPSANGTDHGREIRSRAGGKPTPTRLEPVGRSLQPEPARAGTPERYVPERYVLVRRDASAVRHAGERKPGATRIEPVTRQPGAAPDAGPPVPAGWTVSQPRPGVVVREPAGGKVSQPRLQAAPPASQASSGPRPAAAPPAGGSPRMAPPRNNRSSDARTPRPRADDQPRPKDPDRRKRD